MVWLVAIVLPMGLQPPLSPSALPLASLGSVQWLAVSIHIYIGQVLVELFRQEPFQAPFRKCFLASVIVSRFGVCKCDGSLCEAVVLWLAFPSVAASFLVRDKQKHPVQFCKWKLQALIYIVTFEI